MIEKEKRFQEDFHGKNVVFNFYKHFIMVFSMIISALPIDQAGCKNPDL